MVSYSAHPTNISHLSRALFPGDYPSSLVRLAEHRDFDFRWFASGAIGSHRVKGIGEREFSMCDTLAAKLYAKSEVSNSNGNDRPANLYGRYPR